MLTGILYTLVGIKTKWLHTFLSTAYLVSLAVTILIIYLVHPPITNAVQGAFFVAAFATGILFGGGSVIFADLTEGLVCLLGGFCLSMWFLELRPDGLIQSTVGKSIFIACFTLGAYSLYVSHLTRPYGLIGSISFAGSTIIVLGIDCFSRAGLKEFWVYIWSEDPQWCHYAIELLLTERPRFESGSTTARLYRAVSNHEGDAGRDRCYCATFLDWCDVAVEGVENGQKAQSTESRSTHR